MSTALTGDFEAVLQVSRGTLDRLLANMHQNGFADPTLPSFPHEVHFRFGDVQLDGVRGPVRAQIGVPRVRLIDGATDRVGIEFDLRARYKGDPGSKPLADVIHGTVRATYRLEDIDPSCRGWADIAEDYLWLRVIENSVSFDGDAFDEVDLLTLTRVLDEAAVKALVTRRLATLLASDFEPAPQRVSRHFRRGLVRSLAAGGRAGVVAPVAISSETPAGDPASITQLVLGSRDVALAVSAEYMIAAIQPHLNAIEGLQRDLHVHGDAGIGGGLEIDYHVRVDSANVAWIGAVPPLPGGFIRVRITAAGWASRLYRSGVYNIGSVAIEELRTSFVVDQLLMLSFDPATERLGIVALAPAVSVTYDGPFAGDIRPRAGDEIAKHVQGGLAAALGEARSRLDAATGPARKAPLVEQLRTIDRAADARFDEIKFRPDGLVLRGVIRLSHRHLPHVGFRKTAADDGFDAIDSWIPGGRIDAFHWTWGWFTSSPLESPSGAAGSQNEEDSFVLYRPRGARSRFGLYLSREHPLPGLDGSGRICLTVTGVRVDADSGELVRVTSVTECTQFGHQFRLPELIAGPYVRVCDPLREEIGVRRVGVFEPQEPPANTLVLHVGEHWSEQAAATLRAGVGDCRREGAGLLVVVLLRDGALEGIDRDALEALEASLEAPLLVHEDVGGGWAPVLARSVGGPAWRLLSPDGVVTWAHDGDVEAKELSATLERRLVASPPPRPAAIRPALTVSAKASLRFRLPRCPPPPIGGRGDSQVVFVHKDHPSSLARLAQLVGGGPPTIVVVAAADTRAIDALKLAVPAFPDPDGELSRAAGVTFWPTTLRFDDRAVLTRIVLGIER